jgi:hypothetical protein
MSRTLILIIQLILVTGLCFGVGMYLANWLEKKKRARRKLKPDSHSIPMSAFSTLDHPLAQESANDMTPLEEAEVFMIYGKKTKAREVLRAALTKKRISREEYDAFKAKHGIE